MNDEAPDRTLEAALDEALEETFPASDPIAVDPFWPSAAAASHTPAREADVASMDVGLDHRPVQLARPLDEHDHLRGSLSAPVQLVEYGDYECPFCADARPGVDRLVDNFKAEVVFAWRHFPLVSQHPNAWPAAVAAEAAGRQGRFWDMHNHLLSHQHRLTADELRNHADALGLDMERFDADVHDAEVAAGVREDALSGLRSGVTGTPTFFVAGRRLEGGFRPDQLRSAIESALAALN